MSWNYRVVKRTYNVTHGDPCDFYTIHEVYYEEDGTPRAWCPEPSEPRGDSLEELANDLKHMLEALEKPLFEVPQEWQ